jgi:uncharacterized protein (DUF2062 family)/2-polyprenyl-3-methyl-5-hydroxy-6-metoxy-1,4-benzoquinol methylase
VPRVESLDPFVTTSPQHAELSRFQRLVYELRTEGGGRGQQAASVGVGVFVGCLPVWGFHLGICIALGKLFRLSRMKMYLAANISNPLLAPLLLIAAVQLGAFVRRDDLYGLSWHEWRQLDAAAFGWDLVIGSVLLGLLLGVAAAALTWMLSRPNTAVRDFLGRVADRYLPASFTAWEFARNKLRGDPLYSEVLFGGHLPARGRLLDVGCGQGLLLATLATARSWNASGQWPSEWTRPPELDLHGFDVRQRPVEIARIALGSEATVTCGDARRATFQQYDAIAICDVLHLLSREEQDDLLKTLAGALSPGGVLLVREADGGAGWGVGLVKAVNFVRGLAHGTWRRFAFRSAHDWQRALAGMGLRVEVHPAGAGTPFPNVLLVARAGALECRGGSRTVPTGVAHQP